jgi:hypothetical protein
VRVARGSDLVFFRAGFGEVRPILEEVHDPDSPCAQAKSECLGHHPEVIAIYGYWLTLFKFDLDVVRSQQ